MRNFFKIFFASFLALIIFTVVGVIILVWSIGSAASPDKPEVGSNAVLVVDLTKQYYEQKEESPFSAFSSNSDKDVPGLFDMVRMIHFAKTDNSVKGLYIKCDDNLNGFAASQELRNAVVDFKQSKKFVIAYGDVISQKAYFVANAADKVYCNPKGTLDWRGFATTLLFLKGTLERLEIKPQIFYAGRFKSATEPLREYKMTEANRLQTSVYLNDLYSNLLVTTAQKTNTDTATLHRLANDGAVQFASDALKYKLIDGLKYDDEVKSEIINVLGIKADDKINFIMPGRYAKAVNFNKGTGSRIAVIYAEGDIVDGKGGDQQVGSDDFKNLIRKARLDKDIKAIVLRVNSPGGSALASEIIWREITLTKKQKPVVVSFGDVAASGGYYISCNADSIFAQPNTITGSIGVFGIIPNMEGFFKNKLGVTFDGVKTGQFADLGAINRPLNEAEKSLVQNQINTIYTDFKSRVSEGRKISMVMVDSIAQGRVWTGARALQIGLVDRIGGIQDAVNCAARLAKLKEFRLKEYPEQQSFFEKIMDTKKEEIKMNAIKEEVGIEQYKILVQLKNIKKMISIPQARLPFEWEIH